jgi:hypothetical protein
VARYTRRGLVRLIVGRKERELLAFGHQLAQSSAFFKAALKKEWLEGKTKVIRLHEKVKVVRHYLDFLYSGTLPSTTITTTEAILSQPISPYKALFRLYAFGERRLDNAVRNAAMKETMRLIRLTDSQGIYIGPGKDAIASLYKHTPPNSPMRRLLVDIHVVYGSPQWLDGMEEICLEHVVTAAKALTRKVEQMHVPGTSLHDSIHAKNYLLKD